MSSEGLEEHSEGTTDPISEPVPPVVDSLKDATSTIDELTIALADFSKIPPADAAPSLTCCCGREDCENTKGWLSFKSEIEGRLTLCAQVGQALLKRHELYVQQHNERLKDSQSSESVEFQIAELRKENARLEKQADRALMNSEVVEASKNSLLRELEEAREAVSQLSVHHARSVGLETRLETVFREKDDIQQERDSEAHRAKLAESRIVTLKERTDRLQAEVRRLQDDLEQRRLHRLESSESLLQDARAHLDQLQHSHTTNSFLAENSEITKVLEELVADNESLKRDNTELQELLSSSREDVRALREELEEQRLFTQPPRPRTPPSHHLYPIGPASANDGHHPASPFSRRAQSRESRHRRNIALEPLTPETSLRPLSPESFSHTDAKAHYHPQQHVHATRPHDIESDDHPHEGPELTPVPNKPKEHMTLYLLTRAVGVQTDIAASFISGLSPASQSLGLSGASALSPQDGHSESSSLLDGHIPQSSSHLAIIIERFNALFTRMTQADALTLTNRLKRQNLKGADVGHLSRSTVQSLIAEATSLRSQFRWLMDDDRMTITCTRKDLRNLFKLLRDLFSELGQLRITVNEVILDPSIGGKLRDAALHPSKAEAAERDKDSGNSIGAGWMAPISKLFGGHSTAADPSPGTRLLGASPMQRSTSKGPTARTPSRAVPKLGPALSASATTVNVEFSGAGVGRAVTTTPSPQPSPHGEPMGRISSPPPADVARSVMGIFAGAPRNPLGVADPWVVLPKDSAVPVDSPVSGAAPSLFNAATIGRSSVTSSTNRRMSRQVDAVIDGQPTPGFYPALLDRTRTLHRRGVSDSTIHTTFLQDHPEDAIPPDALPESVSAEYGTPGRASVLQALSKKMQSFRFGGTQASAGFDPSEGVTDTGGVDPVPRASAPAPSGLLPSLSTWTVSSHGPSPGRDGGPYFGSPPNSDTPIGRRGPGRNMPGRDL